MNDVLENINKQEFQLIDARPVGRFKGVDEEPRKGIRSGHVPGNNFLKFNYYSN